MNVRPASAAIVRTLVVIAAFAALELLCRTSVINRMTMIPPTEMVGALCQILISGKFNADIAFTVVNTAAAVALSVVGGFVIGAALHAFPRVRHAFDPLLAAYYAVPVFVFYPLLIVAFGVGRSALIAMGALVGIVAMIVNTLSGLDRVSPVLTKTADVMQMDRLRKLILIRLPAAGPHLITGVKLSVAYSVIGIVAGEFILATAGMGKRIAFGYQDFDNRTMYGMLLLLLILVMAINGALALWEKRLHRRFGQQ
ncbi:MAG: ABC transporter permease [Xanthobacteraceae bacterium]